MSNSAQPHRWQPTRFCHPWDSPGKNTGVGYHFLLQCMKVKSEREVAQLCPTCLIPHGQQPTRLLHPWDFPGKKTGVVLAKKRCITWELWVKFYLGQNEDCTLWDSISDSFERLLQSGSGGKTIYKVLVKGEFIAMKHSFYKRFLFVMRILRHHEGI